ncbi:hypothetical protein CH299_01450 [Rhodococcus sp. 14-2686-1-2]|nr:hypothetical protein CH301_01450 [Rhodococcus sp. 15-1189-1-1a]OZF22294.1 hypothetical protein CH299_01450 [Rhodococcus sp. 14-2686-1-2]
MEPNVLGLRRTEKEHRTGAERVVDMGERPSMEIDIEKVGRVAAELDASSQAVADVALVAAKLGLGPAAAGRNYGDVGLRIAAGYDGVEAGIRRWGEAVKDNAVSLRAVLAAYQAADGRTSWAIATPEGSR